ncbi:MAG: thermonuclease family protein [Algoriphagus sp.]|uniref:thermonuclease family protein n=1 Tax=Algoriphagus sp. TaxID=1872435 RepID=UPI0027312D72|nr:thermonuclease family protein [Algoriphagus sp.]MDP3471929.1 thermonuclease family protein [Algoriphagus sp.]
MFSAFGQQRTDFLEVSKVVDGDTFWVINSRGKEEKIRLIGVNTPEVRNTARTQVEYFGKEASDFVKALLTGRRVRLEYDVGRYDRYKRTLAYVYLEDGPFLNALLVKEGYANVATYPPNVKYVELFMKLEREARNKKKGLWKE